MYFCISLSCMLLFISNYSCTDHIRLLHVFKKLTKVSVTLETLGMHNWLTT